MSRLFKVLGIVVGAVVALFVIVLVLIGLLVDPNDYKDDITAAVKTSTGRELTLDGNLELELFPTIRIALGGATLSNAPGFGSEPMARIANAELRVALLPLFSKRVEVSQARLTGLVLNLARDARGRNNWQDLGGNAAAAQPSAASAGDGPGVDLGIGAIEIADARVTWNDASTGSRWELTDFGLDASGFGPGAKFPLHLEFGLSGADMQLKVDADMQATLVLASNEYRLEQLAVTVDGSGPAWPGGPSEAKLKFGSLVANLGAESLELGGLTIDFLGLTMSGSLAGQKLLSDLSLTGAVDIHDFEPRDLMTRFGIKVDTADGNVLEHASAKANLLYNSRQVGLRDMQLALDDSKLTGRVGLEGERLVYDLNVDDINVDRYLPPSDASDAPADEGSLDEVDLPLDVFRTLNARGELKFGKAQFSGLTLTNAVFALNAGNGVVRLTPTAQLYGGKLAGDVRIQVQDKAARVNVDQTLDDVNIAALGQDLLGSQDITGTGDVRLKLTAAGSNVGQIRRDLDGDVSFTVANGSLEGIDLWYELRRARAVIDKAPTPAREGAARTTFSSLAATGVVEDALLTNRDLRGQLDFMTITGMGSVNLLDNKIAFDLKATLTDGPVLQSDPEMAKLAGQTLPLRVSGTLDAPSVLPDLGALTRARVTSEVNKAVEEKVGDKQEAIDSARDKLRDKLRDKIGR